MGLYNFGMMIGSKLLDWMNNHIIKCKWKKKHKRSQTLKILRKSPSITGMGAVIWQIMAKGGGKEDSQRRSMVDNLMTIWGQGKPCPNPLTLRENMFAESHAFATISTRLFLTVVFCNISWCNKNKLRRYPQQFESFGFFFTLPAGTSPNIFTVSLRNLTEYLHRKLPEPHNVSARRNPLESHQVSAPQPWTLQNLARNLARNLVLKLHRIAPELIWAKDPIAKFCCWGKTCFGLSRDHDAAATLGRNASSLSRLENMCGKPKHSANLVEMSRTQSKHFTLNKTFRGWTVRVKSQPRLCWNIIIRLLLVTVLKHNRILLSNSAWYNGLSFEKLKCTCKYFLLDLPVWFQMYNPSKSYHRRELFGHWQTESDITSWLSRFSNPHVTRRKLLREKLSQCKFWAKKQLRAVVKCATFAVGPNWY